MTRGKSDSLGQASDPAKEAYEPATLFPDSQCPAPSRFWQVALGTCHLLTSSEHDHLETCPRCRDHLAQVIQTVQHPVPDPEDDCDDLPPVVEETAVGVAAGTAELFPPVPESAAVPEPIPRVAALVAALESPRAVVVCPYGGGQYVTIGAALRNASPGTRLLLRPGLYREELVLDRSVEILGEGPPHHIIVESYGGPCVRMLTERAVVRGLTLRGLAGRRQQRHFAVDIPRGRLVLEDCDITSDSLACIAIHGSAAEPVLRRCWVHHGQASGVLVWDEGRGRLEECDVSGNGAAGVQVQLGGNPFLWRCRIHDNQQAGIDVSASGLGTAEECDIARNDEAGASVTYEGNLLMRRCRIHDGGGPGLWLSANGQATLADCEIVNQAGPAVALGAGGSPRILGSHLHQNRGGSFEFHDQSPVLLQGPPATDRARAGRSAVAFSARLQ